MTENQTATETADLEKKLIQEVERHLMEPEHRQEIQNVMAQRSNDAAEYRGKLNVAFEKIAAKILPQLKTAKGAEGCEITLTISVTEQQAKAGGLQPTILVVCA
ncbi:MAG: hypothetical protein QNL04_01765 [SAR324 cluster bacterium]|nr:hypothetical protein [SAR324 cluster bacterium]